MHKFMKRRSPDKVHDLPPEPMKKQPAWRGEHLSLTSDSEAEAANPFYFAGRCLLFLLLAGW